MRKPSTPGTPIDRVRLRSWTREFHGYRTAVTEGKINRWLSQFAAEHRDLAARTLDAVDFLSAERIALAYRALLANLAGWQRNPRRRSGKWRFVAFSGSAGESGDEMLRRFRHANNLTNARYGQLFIHRSELIKESLQSGDSVVFVDDFSGTGKQAVDFWPQFEELLPEGPTAHLLLVAATATAVRRIADHTSLAAHPYATLDDAHNLFLDACRHFSRDDKSTLLTYCKRADKHNPKGFGDCGLTLVFPHACPNNSLPILHAGSPTWKGLFPRYD